MQIELLKEKPMRGCIFEHIGRIWIRRQQNNNYIFATRQFDSLQQIIDRYQININNSSSKINQILYIIKDNFSKFDLIEFQLNSKEEKNITNINIYDVKSTYYSVRKPYFEFCKSNFDFLIQLEEECNLKPKIISIILFKNWNCDIQLFEFDKRKSRVYKYHAKIG